MPDLKLLFPEAAHEKRTHKTLKVALVVTVYGRLNT